MLRNFSIFTALTKVSLVFVLGLFFQSAWALRTQFPLGHVEALTGGIAVGTLGGAGGLIYNPASLGGVNNTELSASGSTYFFAQSKFRSGGGMTALNAVPNSVLSAWKLGNGTLGLGIFVPESFDLKMEMTLSGFSTSGSSSNLQRTQPALEEKSFSLMMTFGALWRRKDFESTFGVFNSQNIVLAESDAQRSSAASTDPNSQVFAGIMLSGLYHY